MNENAKLILVIFVSILISVGTCYILIKPQLGPQGPPGESIVGSQGIQGERGPQGIQGEQGAPGESSIVWIALDDFETVWETNITWPGKMEVEVEAGIGIFEVYAYREKDYTAIKVLIEEVKIRPEQYNIYQVLVEATGKEVTRRIVVPGPAKYSVEVTCTYKDEFRISFLQSKR